MAPVDPTAHSNLLLTFLFDPEPDGVPSPAQNTAFFHGFKRNQRDLEHRLLTALDDFECAQRLAFDKWGDQRIGPGDLGLNSD